MPQITLPVPDHSTVHDDGFYTPVLMDVVLYTMEVLHCVVARWSYLDFVEHEDDLATRLLAAAHHALADLIDASAAQDREHGVDALVAQIAGFFSGPNARQTLEALRSRTDHADVVDALLTIEPRLRWKPPDKAEPADAAESPTMDQPATPPEN